MTTQKVVEMDKNDMVTRRSSESFKLTILAERKTISIKTQDKNHL
ncbi:MAG: hypothetical protein DDT31_01910 [Syntrophomonadaceae bacterium]|nr:hypothetical protein [Bacillota bacterium]